MKNKKVLVSVSPQLKEDLADLSSHPRFDSFINFLKIQQNNIAVIEWFRLRSSEKGSELRRRKAYYEGQFDFAKMILSLFDGLKKEEK